MSDKSDKHLHSEPFHEDYILLEELPEELREVIKTVEAEREAEAEGRPKRAEQPKEKGCGCGG